MIIFFDIETISEFSEKERALNKTEVTQRTPISIMVEMTENVTEYTKLQEKYGERFNFMPEFNKILTITCGTITKDGNAIKNLPGNEEEQIKAFFKAIEKNKVCGFNIKNFDLPFIIKRALKYGIIIPDDLKQYGKKPRELDNIIDLKDIYNYGVFGNFGNLDLICNFLDIPTPKQGINGSQVQQYHDEGKDEEILEYCKRDVEATMNVYEKFVDLNLI